MVPVYDPVAVERRWRERWERDDLYRVDLDASGDTFYNLVEFPYPSADGLHVGHVRTYAGADVHGRWQRMRGRSVFQPMGFDSFGIHTENYALRTAQHPAELTERTIANFRRQLSAFGAAWDWSRTLRTSDPDYYRWTQWIFLRLFEAGLAYRDTASVVWCPSCLTVLAFEQLEGDRCERCDTRVSHRRMQQWFLRITAYAEELHHGLEALDWPDWAKSEQRAWIGRSEGVELGFRVSGTDIELPVFTTRIDTLSGVTFLAVAPEAELLERLVTSDRRSALDAFLASRSVTDRFKGGSDGVFTGACALHPVTGEKVPVWVAGYVVAEYGSGVVMGVPSCDARDRAFAETHGLPIKDVVEGPVVGRRTVRYRLRDWLVSRQRYWGAPIPIVHCPDCGPVAVPDEELPVRLPWLEDFRPMGTGESPLASVDAFVRTSCPHCSGPANRETDVLDTFVDSSWYFWRYPSVEITDRPWDDDRTRRVLPVDRYEAGREHVRRHHLYARFVAMALHDLGLVPVREPLPRLSFHGLMVMSGAKMSKSRGNVVVPDPFFDTVGADNLRLYLLFAGPWESGPQFSDEALAGMVRFTTRVWRLVTGPEPAGGGIEDTRPLDHAVHRVNRDIDRYRFNTAIAAIMELVRRAAEVRDEMTTEQWHRTQRTIVLLLAPFAPHLAEELWERIGETYSVHEQRWPEHDADALKADRVEIAIQVSGRVRDTITVAAGTAEHDVLETALAQDRIRDALGGRQPSRVVFVPDRILNLVLDA